MDLEVNADIKHNNLPLIIQKLVNSATSYTCLSVNFRSEAVKWASTLEEKMVGILLCVGVIKIKGDIDKYKQNASSWLFTAAIKIKLYNPGFLVTRPPPTPTFTPTPITSLNHPQPHQTNSKTSITIPTRPTKSKNSVSIPTMITLGDTSTHSTKSEAEHRVSTHLDQSCYIYKCTNYAHCYQCCKVLLPWRHFMIVYSEDSIH